MKWEELKYEKQEINYAGKILINKNTSEEERNKAISILDNWRAVHGYPIHIFQMTLKKKAQNVDKNSLVAQRLKRAPAIIYKLKRSYQGHNPSMKLYQMQDIGGCRAVLPNIALARKLYECYLKSDLKHRLANKKNYVDIKNKENKIDGPKADGYRGFHLVYEYLSDKEGKKNYNGILVEVQIRSKLQHLWATAVETTGFFTRQAIKTNEGDKEWADFFKLISSAFAKLEDCPSVPDTPQDEKELYLEIKKREKELKFIDIMTGWKGVINFFEKEIKAKKNKKVKFFLLELDILGRKTIIKSYTEKEEQKAIEDYSALEKRHPDSKDYDVVLVGTNTLNDLKKAYPSYFLDIDEFLNYLKKIIIKYK